MCPDYQILSVYFDGELPSPWKEKMEVHLGSCPHCRAQLEQFKRCSQVLKRSENVKLLVPEMPAMEAAKDRVWQNLRSLDTGTWGWKQWRSLWGRTVSIPLPAVAAVAAVFFIVFVLALTRPPAVVPQNQEAMAGLDMQGIVPVSDMNNVLQYLGNQDTADIVIIRLPESKSFFSSGEPTILKAADYSRRTGSQ